MEPLAVLGPRRALPLLRGPALGLAGGGGLPLVEQAVAERVLAFQVGAHAEFADGVARDDRVLVGAQHGLDLLHPPGEPPGRLAGDRPGRLGRVPGALGRPPRTVQRHVPGLAVGGPYGPPHPPAGPPGPAGPARGPGAPPPPAPPPGARRACPHSAPSPP